VTDFEPSRVTGDSLLEQPDQSDSGRQENRDIIDKLQMKVWAINALPNLIVAATIFFV